MNFFMHKIDLFPYTSILTIVFGAQKNCLPTSCYVLDEKEEN